MAGIKIELLGVKELEDKLNKLPIEVANEALSEVQDYMVNVLRMYPPKNYVTRKQAYGKTFQSDRQRRWFFANLREGNITVPYKRTQGLAKGWHKVRSGITGYIANWQPYAVYVMGDRKQSRHEALVGWKRISDIIKERMDKMSKIVDAAAKKVLKKLKLN